MNRRKLLKYMAGLTAGISSLGLYTFLFEPKWVEFTHHEMKLPALPKSLTGAKLVQLSDIHIGPRFDWTYMKDAFAKINGMQPDIVVYTGDYVSYKNEKQLTQLKEAVQYFPKGTKATVASLGNHDYGKGWNDPNVADQIVKILEENAITVLRNKSTKIDGLKILGLEDYWGVEWNSAVAKTRLENDKPQLVLCHNPDVCDLPIWGSFEGYILAGHTHGGQVKPPFLPPPMLPVKNKKYSQGHFKLDHRRQLYINRAIGCLWPVRFNVRPEVTVFTLA